MIVAIGISENDFFPLLDENHLVNYVHELATSKDVAWP